MTYDDLKNELLKYSNEIKGQTAKTPSFVDIKNKIRQAYDAGSIDQELMKELGDKASHAFKNMGKAKNLEDIPQTIANAGGKVGQVEGMTSKFGNTLSKLGKAVPVVAGIAAMAPTLSKASEGDYKGAALEAGNSALDMSPLGTLKSTIS